MWNRMNEIRIANDVGEDFSFSRKVYVSLEDVLGLANSSMRSDCTRTLPKDVLEDNLLRGALFFVTFPKYTVIW